MSFGEAISSCFRQYAGFDGRASRSEYWFWNLFYWLMLMGSGFMMGVDPEFGGILYALVTLGILLPSLAVMVRRLHDLDKSGWMWLVCLIPLVGGIVLLVWFCQPGTNGTNRFGADPLGGSTQATG